MFYVIFMDDSYKFHVSRVFPTQKEAAAYMATLSPTREPFIVERIPA